mgnify:CR=1 FL=1
MNGNRQACCNSASVASGRAVIRKTSRASSSLDNERPRNFVCRRGAIEPVVTVRNLRNLDRHIDRVGLAGVVTRARVLVRARCAVALTLGVAPRRLAGIGLMMVPGDRRGLACAVGLVEIG